MENKFQLSINGKQYYAEYKERNGDGDAAGFGYRIIDKKTKQSVGYLRVLIYGTAGAMWSNHTKYPYGSVADAERTVKTAIRSVLSSYNFDVNPQYFERMAYRGDNITVQITTLDDAASPNEGLYTLKSYQSPEDFVAFHLFGAQVEKSKVRRVVLQKINQWEELNYRIPYSTRDLQSELFLDESNVHRTVDYLCGEGVGYIRKTPAGDDEYNLRLNPAGIDYLESIEKVTSGSASSTATELNDNVYHALTKLNKEFGDSYSQVVQDLNDENRRTWKGTANELRELVGATLRLLAPDAKVKSQEWYEQNSGTSGPTQKQRVRFILAQRNVGSKESELLKELESFDDRIATFGRKLYDRANNSTHQYSERKEIIRLHNYFVAFMSDLLDTD